MWNGLEFADDPDVIRSQQHFTVIEYGGHIRALINMPVD